MKISCTHRAASLLLATLFACVMHAQETPATGERCPSPIYERKELTQPAKVISKPAPEFTEEARRHSVCGTIKMSVVLCRNGRVTDVEVTQGLPHGMNEMVERSASRITFTPAEKDGQHASQRIKIEYNFNIDDCAPQSKCVESPELCAGKLVEEIQVEGNRRLRDDDVFYYIQTRPGDPFNATQVQRDLQALLQLPFFDKTQTRVTIAGGPRGGIIVIFTVKELPLIRDLTFQGLKTVSEADVLKVLRERRAGVWKELVYDPVKVKNAERIIRELLAERGLPDASVEARVEEVSSVSVTLEFVIDEKQPQVEPDPEEMPWRIGPIPLWRRPGAPRSLRTPPACARIQRGVEILTDV